MTLEDRAAIVERSTTGEKRDGARETYQALKHDLEEYANTHWTKQGEVYWNQMAMLLYRAGVLPELAMDTTGHVKQMEPGRHTEHAGHSGHAGHAEDPAHAGRPGHAGHAEQMNPPGHAADQAGRPTRPSETENISDAPAPTQAPQDKTVELASKRIEQALFELEHPGDRSQAMIEKDLRDTLRTLNSEQIKQLNLPESVRDALLHNDKLTPQTRDALAIYLRGNDKLSDKDAQDLISISLRANDLAMFSEAMRNATPDQRKAFLDQGGADKIKSAFGEDQFNHAMDFAKYGKLDVATQIADNTHFLDDNEEGIELALKRMTNEERLQYLLGKKLSGEDVPLSKEDAAQLASMTAEEKQEAQAYYGRIHDALAEAGDASELVKWENMIAVRDGSFVSKLAAHDGVFWNDDPTDILEDIDDMSPADWKDAKENPERREELRRMLESLDEDAGTIEMILTAYDKKLLATSFEESQKTESTDILTKIHAQNDNFNTDEDQVVRDLRDAFEKDPTLRERLLNPVTEADKKYAEELKAAAMEALGPTMYASVMDQLLKNGRLSIETVTELDKGFFSDDEMGTYEDLAHLSAEEKKRLLEDSAYREKILGHLNEDEMKVAMNVIAQGELDAADKVHATVLGYGGASSVVEELQGLAPEQIDEVRKRYLTKYGVSLDSAIEEKLSGQDLVDAKRALAGNLSVQEQADLAKDEYYKTRSGFGAWLADNVWESGTGFQADDAIDELTKAEADAHKVFEAVPEEKLTVLLDDMRTAVDNHRETKAAAADIASDVVITAAAVASVVVSGGTTLPLVVGLAMAGAMIKVGTKHLLMGADYDPNLSELFKDAGMGAITGGLTVLGPGELGAIFKVGDAAASSACKKLLAEKALSVVMKDGSEEVLEKGVKKLVVDALSSGATQVDDAAIKKLSEKLVMSELTGTARQVEVDLMAQNIAKTLKSELAHETQDFFTTLARKELLDGGAGAIGSGSGGFFTGITEWDSQKSLGENLTMVFNETGSAALGGALGASLMSNAFSCMGKLASKAEAAYGDDLIVGSDVLKENEMLTFGKEQYTGDGSHRDYISAKHVSIAKNEDGQMLIMDHSASGTYVKHAGSEGFIRLEKGVPTKLELGDEVRLGSPNGDWLPIGKNSTSGLTAAQRTPFERVSELHRSSYNPELDNALLQRLDFEPGKVSTFEELGERIEHEGMDKIHMRSKPGPNGAYVPDFEMKANVYQVQGHNTRIRVPEDFDLKLDEVRALRRQASKASILDELDDNLRMKLTRIAQDQPEALTTILNRTFPEQAEACLIAKEVLDARAKLAAHPQGDCMMPEDVVSMLDLSPTAPLAKTVDLFEDRSSSAVADALRGEDRNFYDADRRIRIFGARLEDPTGLSDKSTTLNSIVTSDDLAATFLHEESHLVPQGWQKVYEKGHKFEAPSKYHVSHYASTKVCEDYAESRGGVFLFHDGEKFLEMAENAPIRTAIMAREIEIGLLASPNGMDNPNLSKICNRIEYVKSDVVPVAKKQLMDAVEAKLERHKFLLENPSAELLDELRIADDEIGDVVRDALKILTVIGNKKDIEALQKLAKRYEQQAHDLTLEYQFQAMDFLSVGPQEAVAQEFYYIPKLEYYDFVSMY